MTSPVEKINLARVKTKLVPVSPSFAIFVYAMIYYFVQVLPIEVKQQNNDENIRRKKSCKAGAMIGEGIKLRSPCPLSFYERNVFRA
jgi:hypothetical protein